jgi:AsmA protein
MQETHTHSDADPDLETASPNLRHRLAIALCIVLAILLLAFIPPLINVSRFQRRVDNNISTALGRPVHFDKLSLNLLPMPGFTLENFVVDEDPAFGSEPILWASEVNVTLRLSSLWGRHVEFSKISLADPNSVNLVHLSDGRWNIEALLFQAAHIQSSPTAQRFAGSAPRFPYIEATGTRLNLKLDEEKAPFSFTDAEFALWQPQEHQWSVRLQAHPSRTDVSPADTGTVRVEGTLGGGVATPSSLADTPINLQGRWQDAQLGGLSQLVSGSDAGLRGDLSMTFNLVGTVARNTITTDIKLDNARRAEFIPPSPLSLEAGCKANASDTFHAFTSIECYWPPAESSDRSTLIVTANLPDVRQPGSSTGRITLPALPAETFFNWLSVATPHPPTGLAGPGNLAGAIAWAPDSKAPRPEQSWSGELEFSNGSLAIGGPGQKPISLGDVILRSTPQTAIPAARSHHPAVLPAPVPDGFDLEPVTLDLGGKDPATLTGHLDDTGYTLHLSGSAIPTRLLALGNAIPQLGDGLKDCLQHLALIPPTDSPQPAPAPRGGARGSAIQPGDSAETPPVQDQPTQIDLTATRVWGSAQSWAPASAPTPPAPHSPSRLLPPQR